MVLHSNIKRWFAVLLSLIMVLSSMPMHTMASEAPGSQIPELIQTTEITASATESVAPAKEPTATSDPSEVFTDTSYQALISRMAAILNQYEVTADMTDEQIAAAIIAVDGETLKATMAEIDSINAGLETVSEDSAENIDVQTLETYFRFTAILSQLTEPATIADVGTINNVAITYDNTDTTVKLNNVGGITATADGWGSWPIFFARTVNITLTNKSGIEQTLHFDYSVTQHGSFSIGGDTSVSTSGHYEGTISATGKLVIMLKSKKDKSTVATLTVSNIRLEPIQETSTVTVQFDSNLCSVKANNNPVASTNTPIEGITETDGITLTSAPVNGSTFYGWVDAATNTVISTTETFTYKPTTNVTVKPIYSNGAACFRIGKTTLFANLHDAIAAAITGSVIIPINNGTVPAGNYTIPKGVTLLIPYNDADTLCTTMPTQDVRETVDLALVKFYEANAYVSPKDKVYRKLTLANGANLTVNGAISLSAMQCAQQNYNAHPTGYVSILQMDSGSSITVNNGGALYAWGYITGDGTVTVESGGVVYEEFQTTTWRGGTASTTMIDDSNKNSYGVFPLNQYYVQNVEVPMTMKYGAKELGHISIVASGGLFSAHVEFIGSSGLFRLGSNSTLTKSYDETTDRLNVTVNGNLTLSSLVVGLSSYSMNSNEYILPLNHNISVSCRNGTVSVAERFAMLPGSEIYVESTATVTIGKSFYIYDAASWGPYVYAGISVFPVRYSPSWATDGTNPRGAITDAKITVAGTLDVSAGSIYTTGAANIHGVEGGKVITAAPGTETVTYQAEMGDNPSTEEAEDGSSIRYVSIPITPAKLKNGDGSFTDTSSASEATTYEYYNGMWCCHSTWGDWEQTQAPTFTEAGVETRSCACGKTENRDIVVAKIGEKEYAVLKTALDEANGEIVYLQTSITERFTLEQTASIALSGNSLNFVLDPYFACAVENDNLLTVWAVTDLIVGTNVGVGDSLDMYFYVDKTSLEEGKNYVATVSRKILPADDTKITNEKYVYDTEKEVTDKIPLSEWKEYSQNTNLMRFCYADIAAKEMTEKIRVTIHEADASGNPVKQISTTLEESIETYALRAYDSFAEENNAELWTALTDMLHYGAAAQDEFNYRDGTYAYISADLASAEIGDKTPSADIASQKDTQWTLNPGDAYSLSATVTLESKLDFTFYISGPAGAKSAVVTYKNHRNKDVESEVTFNDNTTVFKVPVENLSVADGRQVITCTLLDADKNALATVQSSVQSYVYSVLNPSTQVAAENLPTETLKTLSQKLMNFIDSSYTYFHRNDPVT